MANRTSSRRREKRPHPLRQTAKMDSQSANMHQISTLYDSLQSAEQEIEELKLTLNGTQERAEQAERLANTYRAMFQRGSLLSLLAGFAAGVGISFCIWVIH